MAIEILSPVSLGPSDVQPLAPRVQSLRGKVLGLRVDHAWRSFLQFGDELRGLARAQGYPDLRMLVLPHPMESRPESEVRAIARERFAALIALIAEEG